jgi:hypothetical protein
MSNSPIDYDSLATRLTDTLQSVDVSSLQQWGETDSTTKDANLAEHAIHETLNEIGTHLEGGQGFEVWSSTTEKNDILDRIYSAELDGSASDRDEESVVEESLEEELVDEESAVEDPLDDDGLMWGYPDQVNDAPVYDWRTDSSAKCCSCLEDQPVEDVWQAPCEHLYCNGCLEVLVNEWYKSTRAPECCGIPMPWEDYKSNINSELAAALDAKKEELDSHDRIYCWERTCSTFIGAAGISPGAATATCGVCKRVTCTTCKAASHMGGCVPDASISNELEQAEQEGWKRCPRCRMVGERVDGCPHMT